MSLFASVDVIGWCDYFGFGFTTLVEKCSELFVLLLLLAIDDNCIYFHSCLFVFPGSWSAPRTTLSLDFSLCQISMVVCQAEKSWCNS